MIDRVDTDGQDKELAMVLSSQQSRPSIGRRPFYSSSRRRRRSKGKHLLVALVVCGLGAAALFAFLNRGDNNQSPAPANAANNNEQPNPLARAQTTANTPANPNHNPAQRTAADNPLSRPINPPAVANITNANAGPDVNTAPETARLMSQGFDMLGQDRPVQGRQALSALLMREGRTLSRADAALILQELTKVNRTLVFSPQITDGDPLVQAYTVKGGDTLTAIARQFHLPWQFVARINGIQNPGSIRPGQTLKLVRGPLHAVVRKNSYRLDVFAEHPTAPIYICSFPVGLGEDDSTPVGNWVVVDKVENPSYTDPRTGSFYRPEDPANPVGGFWIGLEGASPETRHLTSYGIHGTNEQDSIGTQSSMGCVRLRDGDIADLYHMLTPKRSLVAIRQ